MITVKLDSVKKYRNAQEYRNVNRASAEGHSVVGDGSIISRLCADLVGFGRDPATPVQITRENTVCFTICSLGSWASGRALSGKQPEQFRTRHAP